ncbi:hypothetical protein [Saccharibacillus endophyticus]|uniref:Uncharacterized protein n=1 Tax=Saccharibacillus endophyticus TaxID=2060666 RepID=A0ABQ1ZNP9_9BACL|nr:hypothetical protein [Saccharibacillus endophyticus]GGH70238.1 hypothetical protein GCM10007362_06150 [Saccharibacillus endophyticus]
MENYRNPLYDLFRITETGFDVIVILMLAAIISGLVFGFTRYRKNLTRGRIMAMGITFIGLSVVLKYDATFSFRVSALDFYLILLGLALLSVGFCWTNQQAATDKKQ